MCEQHGETSQLDQLRSKGEEAVAELFGRYRDKLLRMVESRLDNRVVGKVDCEDVLQDAFMEAARRVQDYLDRPSVPFFIWLRQITRQILIDTHRRYLGREMRDVNREARLRQRSPEGASSISLAGLLAGSLTTPSEFAVREEMVSAMETALDRLDDVDREVLVLRHLEDLSNNEVAQILGIDKSAASKRYMRALKRLRSTMPTAE